jgi:large subunit ribosomal protein L31
MRKDIHPEYREVLFHDKSVDVYFLVPSTLKTDETKEWEDGKTYPYCVLDISSASHPFYTGKQKLVDTGGRVDKFRKRFGNKSKAALQLLKRLQLRKL